MNKKIETIITGVEEILQQFEPLFKEHGGGAELVAVEEDEIVLRLTGNCVGCDAAGLHFGAGVEQMIRERFPAVQKITYSY